MSVKKHVLFSRQSTFLLFLYSSFYWLVPIKFSLFSSKHHLFMQVNMIFNKFFTKWLVNSSSKYISIRVFYFCFEDGNLLNLVELCELKSSVVNWFSPNLSIPPSSFIQSSIIHFEHRWLSEQAISSPVQRYLDLLYKHFALEISRTCDAAEQYQRTRLPKEHTCLGSS